MATVIIVILLVLLAVVSVRSYRKKLSSGCCGAGGGSVEETAENKILENPVISKKCFRIEGMTCINCQNRIQRRLNRIEGVSASVDWKAGTAVVSMDRPVPDNTIRMAIVQMDYKVTSITDV